MESIDFKMDEAVSLRLRRLYEHRGFRRVSVSKFEDYDLYVENKNFLQAEHMITFMDMDGKLLALKPDVTLSIVKNIPREPLPAFEKLYYADEVYRLSKENREYKVISQIGVELIGPTDSFSDLEAIDLALESLGVISPSFVLDVSHQGFVTGLLENTGLSVRVRKQLLESIHSKSIHDMHRVLEAAGASAAVKEKVVALSSLHGPLTEILPGAKALVEGPLMEAGWQELAALGSLLEGTGMAGHVNLDFSVVNDVDYYNGLVFVGYVEGVPNVVLTGGRYDNLLARMGKQNGAVGFAVYLSDLATYLKSGGSGSDCDVLITYGDNADYAFLLGEVRRLNREGLRVRLEREDCDPGRLGFTYDRLLCLEGRSLKEETIC